MDSSKVRAVGAAQHVQMTATGSLFVASCVNLQPWLSHSRCTPLTVMLMFDRSSHGRSARTLGIRLTTTNAIRVLGPMVFGAVGTAFGVPSVFWINAVMMAATGVAARKGMAGRAAGG